MKTAHSWCMVIAFTAGIAGCHHGPTALSANGEILKEGQTAYAKRAAIACHSNAELQQATALVAQGDQAAFMAYANEHCGVFDKPEKVKILNIESGTGNQTVVVNDLDDASAPAQLWMASKSLTLNP